MVGFKSDLPNEWFALKSQQMQMDWLKFLLKIIDFEIWLPVSEFVFDQWNNGFGNGRIIVFYAFEEVNLLQTWACNVSVNKDVDDFVAGRKMSATCKVVFDWRSFMLSEKHRPKEFMLQLDLFAEEAVEKAHV